MAKASMALLYQSPSYPTLWEGKVPKRVRMLKTVGPDFPWRLPCTTEMAFERREYECIVNSHGAVSVKLPAGHFLGVKLEEFVVVEWHER